MPQENIFQTQRQKKSLQPCITWKTYSLSETHHKKHETKFSRQKENKERNKQKSGKNVTSKTKKKHMKVWKFLAAQMVKNLPAMRETQVWSLGREDPLKKGIVTPPVFLPGEFHGQRSLVGYSLWSCRVGHDLVTKNNMLRCLPV